MLIPSACVNLVLRSLKPKLWTSLGTKMTPSHFRQNLLITCKLPGIYAITQWKKRSWEPPVYVVAQNVTRATTPLGFISCRTWCKKSYETLRVYILLHLMSAQWTCKHTSATFIRIFTGKIPMPLQSRTNDIKNNTRKSAALYGNLQVKTRRQEKSGTSDVKKATRQNAILYGNLQEKHR